MSYYIEPHRYLNVDEIRLCLADLRERQHLADVRKNLIIFRLSTFCGLRVGEISQLKVGHIAGIGGEKPQLCLPKGIVKGKRKRRFVPLWWDKGTLDDLSAWVRDRNDDEWVLFIKNDPYRQMHVKRIQKRFKTAIRALGPSRVKQLSIHCGRHTFCSLSMYRGRSLPDVMAAAGHSGMGTTSRYVHANVSSEKMPDLLEE